jgi:hypothetical protein
MVGCSIMMEKDDIVKRAHECYSNSTTALKTTNGVDFDGWLAEAQGWYRFVCGDQWDRGDYFVMRGERRPIITFNRTGVMTDVVAGLEIQNRMVPTCFPRQSTDNDSQKAEYMNNILDWVRDDADFEEEESQSFSDLLTCGMGWTDTMVDYEEEMDGNIEKISLDPLRCRYDPACTRKNLKGSRWRMYIMDMTYDEFKRRWPDKEPSGKGPWSQEMDSLYSDVKYLADEAWKYDRNQPHSADEGDGRSGVIHVAKYQYCEYKKKYRVAGPDGLYELTSEEFNERKEQIDVAGLRYVDQEAKVVREALVCGNELIEDKETPTGRFTLECMTGKYDKNNRCFYGLVRPMKDPQMWANKFLSSILDIIASNAKGGVMAESGAFQNERAARKEWSRADRITMLEPGGIDKVAAKPTPPIPAGIQYLLEYTGTMFPHTSGVSLELMGLVQHDQPGILEHARKQSGLSILSWAFSALRYYRKENSKTTLDLVREFMSDGRLFRIEGDAGPELASIIKDEMVFKYDIIVDESPTTINQTERTWQVLSEALPLALQAGIPVPPSVLRYLPLPEKLKVEWLTYIQEQQQAAQDPAQQQAAQQAAQVEIEKTQSETEKNISQAQLNEAKAQEIAQEAPSKVMKNMADARRSTAAAGKDAGAVLGGE